jgi:hypothetical protein
VTEDEQAGVMLLVGNILGLLLLPQVINTKAEPLLDSQGHYTNQIVVKRPSGDYLVTVESMKEIR